MTLPDYAIEIEGLRKTYAGNKRQPPKEALKGIDLKIRRGSIFGLLGPNGAGKSTTINILAGVTNKTSGHVKVWGRDIDKQPRDARAAIGVVPQELAVDVFFTPREALEVQAGFYGVPKTERRTDELLAAMGLSDKANAYVRQLSGGMKRRLMVDKAIVLTTHYLEEAEQLCDTIAIVNHGQVVACEPTGSLLRTLDTRTAVITPAEPLTAAPQLGALEAKLTGDGRLAIDFKTSEAGIEAVLNAVRGAGVTIKDLSIREPDLEDVFLALTYGADKPAA